MAARRLPWYVGRHCPLLMDWPKKNDREALEIECFIKAYALTPGSPRVVVVSKGEKPDFVVRDASGKELGVELTSVYLDDRSVPDAHLPETIGLTEIPFDRVQLEIYGKRLVQAVLDKICRARNGYDLSRPLVLAIYVNEYIGIYLGQPELETLVARYEAVFDDMQPFSEVVFCNLGNGTVFQVKPGPSE